MLQKKQNVNAQANNNNTLRKKTLYDNSVGFYKGKSTFNQRTFKHQAQGRAVRNEKSEVDKLRQDSSTLNRLLNEERKTRLAEKKEKMILSKQLAKEQALKKMYVNRCKELEGLLKNTSAEIPPMFVLTSGQKGKKAHRGDEKMDFNSAGNVNVSAELKAERVKSQRLQQELDKIRGAHQELGVLYQNEMRAAKMEVDSLQKQVEAHAAKVSQDQATMAAMTAEHKALLQKMTQETQSNQDNTKSAQQIIENLQRELQELKQANAGKASQDQAAFVSLKADHDALLQKTAKDKSTMEAMTKEHSALRQKMSEERQTYQANIRYAEQVLGRLQGENQQLKNVNNDKASQDQTSFSSLQAEYQALLEKTADKEKCQTDLLNARQTVDTLQQELHKQMQAHADKVSQDKVTMDAMTKEHKALQQKMAEQSQNYQANIKYAEQVLQSLQQELQKQKDANNVSQDQSVIVSLKAEHQAACQKMVQEISALKQFAAHREQMFSQEMEKLNTQLKARDKVQRDYEELKARTNANVEQFNAAMQEERKKNSVLQVEMERYKSAHQRLTQRQMLLLQNINQSGGNPTTS